MTVKIQLPPRNAPLLNADRTVSQPWWDFFAKVSQVLQPVAGIDGVYAGPTSITLDERGRVTAIS